MTALATDGWRILAVANTATKEHGIDVVAARGGKTAGIEVKGFPSRNYADRARAGERKRTSPSTQAGHWYSQAVLAAMRLRERNQTGAASSCCPTSPATANCTPRSSAHSPQRKSKCGGSIRVGRSTHNRLAGSRRCDAGPWQPRRCDFRCSGATRDSLSACGKVRGLIRLVLCGSRTLGSSAHRHIPSLVSPGS